MMNYYVGHPQQTRGAEQYVLQAGKGDGMHFLYVRNGLGLEVWLSLDRAGDVSRVTFKGDNMGFFAPCGYVAPQYYDCVGGGFLKSFTAGFFTTCGLTAVGAPGEDAGEVLPQHGTIANIPGVLTAMEEDESGLTVKITVRDAIIFGRKLVLRRTYTFSYLENTFAVEDRVTNEGDVTSPFLILYHCNMGYPLLSEKSDVRIPYNAISARSDYARAHIDTALQMELPQTAYAERCYFFDVAEKDNQANIGLYNDDIHAGMVMSYDKRQLPRLTEWKMMGKTDYVLGLEPGNCEPGSRAAMRENGILPFLQPEETATTAVRFTFVTDRDQFEQSF